MNAGNQIRAARERLGWTQAQLGKAAGYSEEYVRLIETGKRHGARAIAKVLAALGEDPGPIAAAAEEIVRVRPRRRSEIEAHAEAHAEKHFGEFVSRAMPMPITQAFSRLAEIADTPVPVEPNLFDDKIEGMTWCADAAGPIHCQVRSDVWTLAQDGEGRCRTTLAHEIAHALLHHPELLARPGAMFRDAEALKPSEQAIEASLMIYEVADWQAAVWAAAWLMPMRAVRGWLESQYDVGAQVTPTDMAKHFQVSVRSAEIRLESALPALAKRPNT